MKQVELFKTNLLELRKEYDLSAKSSFISKMFNRNKIDNISIGKRVNAIVTNDLLSELKTLSNIQAVTECFAAINIFKDILSLEISVPIKRLFINTITESAILNDKEKALFNSLRRTFLIEEQKLKLQTEFNRVVKGGGDTIKIFTSNFYLQVCKREYHLI